MSSVSRLSKTLQNVVILLSEPEQGKQIISYALKKLGTPYGTRHGRMNCSMLVKVAYEKATGGLSLPSTSADGMAHNSLITSFSRATKPEVGDILWVKGHVMLFAGAKTFLAELSRDLPAPIQGLIQALPEGNYVIHSSPRLGRVSLEPWRKKKLFVEKILRPNIFFEKS